jgi:drug/metabolite transporter (DMT)-like permease
MTLAGLAWAAYTVIGKSSRTPLHDTSYNFLRTCPFLVLLWLMSSVDTVLTTNGVILAILSGALASGIGYAIWYAVLPALSSISAGVLQLTVPILAGFGGVIFVSEPLTLRLVVSGLLILMGLFLIILQKVR